jgi:hypothetical protein
MVLPQPQNPALIRFACPKCSQHLSATVAEIAGLKGLKADNEADRKVFRREILKRVLKFKKR